ncbi:MAG: hypothetical protein ABL871_02730 [Terricaulis sp.]
MSNITRLSLAVTAVAACLFAAPASAQDAGSNAQTFVERIALATSPQDSLARWDGEVCVGAVGLAPEQAQALVDRVSVRARAVGLRPGAPGCRANVMVIYAPDSDVVTREIVDQRRDLLGYYADDANVTAGREAMEEFATAPRPIRWWHVSSTGVGSMSPDAEHRMRQSSGRTAALAAARSGISPADIGSPSDIQGVDAVRTNGSRMRNVAVRSNDLSYALIVVDARRVAEIPADAWMDYVALVALAQLDPGADTSGYPTVLNLFASNQTSRPTGLTPWDIAYLEALYRGRPEQSSRQINSIARRISDSAPGQ